MPSSSSWTCSGPISARRISARPWPSSAGASGGSVPVPAEIPVPRKSAWSDLRTRVLSAAVLAPLGLICIWIGSWAWAALVAVAALGMAWEWIGLCRAGVGSFAGLADIVLAVAAVVIAAAGAPGVALAVVVLGWVV